MAEPRRILLVEDDRMILESLGAILEDEGYAVTTAINGAEALQQLKGGFRPNIVLLDLMMPVMSGWELREKMLAEPQLAAIPVIVLSGLHDLGDQQDKLHALSCLTKPIHLERLFETMEAL